MKQYFNNFNFSALLALLFICLSANPAAAQRLDSRDTSRLADNTIFATQDTSLSGSYRWSQTPYSVLRDSIHASYNSTFAPIRFGVPTFKSHLDSPGSASFGNGTNIEFGDTTHWSLTGRSYNLDYFETEFNLFQSHPGANLADTSSFRTTLFGVWSGNIMQSSLGNGNIRLNQFAYTTKPQSQVYKNPSTRFLATRQGGGGVQLNGKTRVFQHLPPHSNIIGTIATANGPRDENPAKATGGVIGSWGISTGSDTLRFGENINSQFRLALARNKSNTLELAFYISDTTFKWQGEMYESPATGIAFFDEKGALHKDTGYQVQVLAHRQLSYQPASATDFQGELADRTAIPDGAKFYYHDEGLSYEYLYDKGRDKLKRVLYAEF